ncbi:conserved hypothetical protein [Vibrio crassostreae]|nr:conserved hypothetical protein [Vibrio crassostreae]CAK2613502.1 conserved hypothetical protein [Vibrio crassostreae]CAK2629341.1 conserved hypothetical protein [Vibrio crassostreae]CAK2669613.1 conserved hypothetical protein [Vibrio crassostreae]CAK2721307.1 conserved hypothetical protein [Vibrio crassostreae]
MTTTIFRKNKDTACIACDSRVTWVNQDGLPIKWLDSEPYRKALSLDGVMYGFAGTNLVYRVFLENYTNEENSEFLLDTCVQFARNKAMQFFIIRYDGENLKLFSYSPPSEQSQEILRISSDPVIDKDCYVIGSGKHSKVYKKHKSNKNAKLPIFKIISANSVGMKKGGVLHLESKVANDELTLNESVEAFHACQKKGGDIFTGGEVKMNRNATQQEINVQVEVLKQMDAQAKAANAVCASPVDANLEVKSLNSLGQYAVSPHSIKMNSQRRNLLEKMESSTQAYL